MIRWTIPNAPVNPEVLTRFHSHFPLPSEAPPIAWFMGDTHWMTWLVDTDPNAYSAKQLEKAMNEIRVGLLCFPQVDYVPLWKAWFHALLPYTLRHIDRDTLQQTPYSDALRACALIYPTQIDEVYPGFRRDLLNTLGTRGIPLTLSRDRLDERSTDALITPILNDIWDLSNAPDAKTPGTFEWFADPMAFCLRYLDADEMRGWVQSIMTIESHQWRLALVTWWTSVHPALKAESGIVLSQFDTFDTLLREHLTRDRFEAWAQQISSLNTFKLAESHETYVLSPQTQSLVSHHLAAFRQHFYESQGARS